MGQTVEQRARQTLGSQRFRPFVKRKITGDQGAATLLALRDQFEQQLRPSLRERHEAQLVDDQQFAGGHLLLEAQQASLVASLHHLADESVWISGLLARRPPRVAIVAVTDKLARIAWGVIARGDDYRGGAISVS
jgi:hypothetical protein